jgi:glutamate synthase domain-containing protein 1
MCGIAGFTIPRGLSAHERRERFERPLQKMTSSLSHRGPDAQDHVLLDGAALSDAVDARIKAFPAGTFDLAATAADFVKDPPIQKRKLLELVAAVNDADEVLDLATLLARAL